MFYKRFAVLLLLLLITVPLTLAGCAAGGENAMPGTDAPPGENDNELPNEEAPPDSEGEGQAQPPLVPPTLPEPQPEPEPEPPKRDTLVLALTSSINIRSGMSTSSAVVGSMDKGDMVAFVSKQNGWYETVYKQKKAYVTANGRYTKLSYFDLGSPAVEKCIELGKTLLGMPYVLGAQRLHWGNGVMNTNFTGKSYDCSSLVQYIYYKKVGVLLDTTTRGQCVQGKYVSKANLKRGDLMFFTNEVRENNTGVNRVGHVAIYLGNNYILHTSSDYAVIEPISTKRWSYFIAGRDVLAR